MDQTEAFSCPAYSPVTGRAPYGYQSAGDGCTAAMAPDPVTAPVVRRIFDDYLRGNGLQVIAEQLTADVVLRPSAYDPDRNPNHVGAAWSKAAVRAIITNPRYIARQAHTSAPDCGGCLRRCAARDQVALVSADVFQQAQATLARHRKPSVNAPVTTRPAGRYALRGLVRCDLCQRLMQGSWNNDTAYYRCRFPREYARANNIDHPTNIYLREDRLVVALQDWIQRSLPARLHEWATRQPPGLRPSLTRRVDKLHRLITSLLPEQAHSLELYSALGVRLTYGAEQHSVHVRSEALPGAVIQSTIKLRERSEPRPDAMPTTGTPRHEPEAARQPTRVVRSPDRKAERLCRLDRFHDRAGYDRHDPPRR